MGKWLFLVLVVALPVTAIGAIYLDEGFEGSWPPAGWYWNISGSGGGGSWSQTTGPWGNCAQGRAAANVNYGVGVRLYSAVLAVTTPVTVYYRFDYDWYRYGTTGSCYFYFYIVRNGSPLFSRTLPVGGWYVYSGSYTLTQTGEYRLHWVAAAVGTANQWMFAYIDNVMVADAPFTAAAPTSLGRVKTLFN